MNFNGSESVPDLNLATILAFDDNTVPIKNSWIAEWRYPSGVVTRRIANRQGKTNIIFKMKLEPVPAGIPCTVCWGNGRPYGVGETPITVTVVIEGIKKTPAWIPPIGDPPDGAFELTQNIFQACTYEFDDINFDMDLIFTPGDATFIVRQAGGPVRSFFATGSVCATFFENEETFAFIGGTATIFVPPVE